MHPRGGGERRQQADERLTCLLLRARYERPCDSAAEQRDELASFHGLPQPEDQTLTHRCREYRVVQHSKIDCRMTEMGQTRSFGGVGSMSGLPEGEHG